MVTMTLDLYKTGIVGPIQMGGGTYTTILKSFRIYLYRKQVHGHTIQGLKGIRGIGVRAFGRRLEFWAWGAR